MAEKSILNTIEKITGEKILRTEKEEPKKEELPKPKRKSGFNNYWVDVHAGRRKHGGWKWKKKKAESPEEPKKEELKPEIKLDKKPPDKEAEEIKKELEEKVSDAEILKKKEKPIIEAKEIKEEEKEEGEEVKFDSTWLIYGLVGLVAIFILMQVFKKSSPPTPPSIPKTKSKIRQFDIGGGRIIEIPV